MHLEASQLVACYLQYKSLQNLLDYHSLNRSPNYDYQPPVSWKVYLSDEVVEKIYSVGNTVGRGFPNRIQLGLLGLLLWLHRPPSYNRKLMLNYLQDNGISYHEIKRCMDYCTKLGLRRAVGSRRHIGMEWKRRTLAKLK